MAFRKALNLFFSVTLRVWAEMVIPFSFHYLVIFYTGRDQFVKFVYWLTVNSTERDFFEHGRLKLERPVRSFSILPKSAMDRVTVELI